MKKGTFFILIILIVAFFLSGCMSGDSGNKDNKEKAGYEDISPEAAKEKLEKESDIVLLDVRTLEEFEQGHIKGSILIPVDELEETAKTKLKDKNATIFVYCRSGNRSVTASNILIDQGYVNVYNLGGIIDWPYEIEK